jgi:hypothetical protein
MKYSDGIVTVCTLHKIMYKLVKIDLLSLSLIINKVINIYKLKLVPTFVINLNSVFRKSIYVQHFYSLSL